MENTAAPSLPAGAQQSQWLYTTLSDLDRKMKVVMTLLKEDNNLLCQKADISHDKLELVRLLGEVNKSYSSLVEKYDQLTSKSQSSSSMSNFMEIQEITINQSKLGDASDDPIMEVAADSHPESVVDDADFEYLNKLADDLALTEKCSMPFIRKPEQTNMEIFYEEDVISKINGFQMGHCERENIQFQINFQFTELMEENLRQQAELLRRNDEKRETINALRLQLERLKSENRALWKCLSCSKSGLKRNQSQTSRSKGIFLGKFFLGGCS